ncbi:MULTISPECIES: anti-phage defense-associated sirtuin Dsr1 [unclassified Legionella]|uniref:anti-phage defense-associated sirtuin Dsr1 n=1 Tax=unclassified Legionella TaxID=2622702 RepID=UPI001054C52D|nr:MULTISPECIES: anti-phage defense-associated sirtuin Dsr1 [unclassified Legionella]MDI9819826.1 SIR2 family protein [Legionella sp. PL877]
MQFVKNGPEIPDRLLQAHEDGRVVFFCGAGISYPANLPGFGGLVKKIYEGIGEIPNDIEKTAIKSGQYDTAIGLLEFRIVDGRNIVRRSLAEVLRPDLNKKNALATHESLLTLSRCHKNGFTRLITTNFDRIFEVIIEKQNLDIDRYQAPFLPIPKSRWNGLVYLHGLLPNKLHDEANNHLVLSSGDFGLAYLNERWAARFVSELFRSHTVCFVGYSINDPILRYMMDALAADRLLGESPPEMFAFGSYSRGKDKEIANEWKAKNVTPILYKEHRRHFYLHKTLREWAKIYHDGVSGKERIVVESAITKPQSSTVEDNFVGRMLWALSDPSGLPAKRFAGNKLLDPAPPIDWLDIFTEKRYGYSDLVQFGVYHLNNQDEKFAFSLLNRPMPNHLMPHMSVVENNFGSQNLDDIMRNLSHWLTRHLNDPKLILWLADQGGQLHPFVAKLIEKELEYLVSLERNGKEDEITTLLKYSESAIPSPKMYKYWLLLLTGRIDSSRNKFELYQWVNQFKQDGLTAVLKIKLRELLSPKIYLRKSIHIRNEIEEFSPDSFIDWELRLASDHVHSALGELSKETSWQANMPKLIDDFTILLRDALELQAELGRANEFADMSYIAQPSISEHPQNRKFDDWTALIELTRDAWLALSVQNPKQAFLEAEKWQFYHYPIFRRLMFFAATQISVIPPNHGLCWLLSDNHRCLWSAETKREAIRLIVALGPHLNRNNLLELEQAIIKGPPNELFSADIELERLEQIKKREIWLRLAKLGKSDVKLSKESLMKLQELEKAYPLWAVADDESDEFSFWMWSGDECQHFLETPQSRQKLVKWIKQYPGDDWRQKDHWEKRCKDNFSTAITALYILTKENCWPSTRWQQALQVWSDDKYITRSWRYVAPMLINAPNKTLDLISHALGYWLKTVAKVALIYHEDVFFELCKRLLKLNYPKIEFDEPVMAAINHPVGYVTQSILNWWFAHKLEDGQGIPQKIYKILTELCDPSIEKFRLARVLITSNAITLFRVDPDWSTKYLLCLFAWDSSKIEARIAWEGFLWTPRLYYPFLEEIKTDLLKTATNFESLGKNSKQQYAAFITYLSLDRGEKFSVSELSDVYRTLPPGGLDIAAEALARAQESAAEQKEVYWDNRIAPFWKNIWPKSREVASQNISKELVRLCIASGKRFPNAVSLMLPWLKPTQNIITSVHWLRDSKHCTNFPEEALNLLNAIIGESLCITSELGDCLSEIKVSNPKLVQDPKFRRLHQIWEKHKSDK